MSNLQTIHHKWDESIEWVIQIFKAENIPDLMPVHEGRFVLSVAATDGHFVPQYYEIGDNISTLVRVGVNKLFNFSNDFKGVLND